MWLGETPASDESEESYYPPLPHIGSSPENRARRAARSVGVGVVSFGHAFGKKAPPAADPAVWPLARPHLFNQILD